MANQVDRRPLSFPSAPRPYRSQPNNIQSHHIFEIESLLQISVKYSLLAPSAKGHAPCISGLRGTDWIRVGWAGAGDWKLILFSTFAQFGNCPSPLHHDPPRGYFTRLVIFFVVWSAVIIMMMQGLICIIPFSKLMHAPVLGPFQEMINIIPFQEMINSHHSIFSIISKTTYCSYSPVNGFHHFEKIIF